MAQRLAAEYPTVTCFGERQEDTPWVSQDAGGDPW